jgi:hypothetical protein
VKFIPVISLLFLTACASPGEDSPTWSAQVLEIRPAHDSYVGGGFKFYTIVKYQVLDSDKIITRYYDTGAPVLKSITLGQIVKLKELKSDADLIK